MASGPLSLPSPSKNPPSLPKTTPFPPDIKRHRDKNTITFTLKSHNDCIQWRNAIANRYKRACELIGPLSMQWEDRSYDEKSIQLEQLLNKPNPKLAKTVYRIFTYDQLAVIITLYFKKRPKKDNGATVLIQGTKGSKWAESEFEELCDMCASGKMESEVAEPSEFQASPLPAAIEKLAPTGEEATYSTSPMPIQLGNSTTNTLDKSTEPSELQASPLPAAIEKLAPTGEEATYSTSPMPIQLGNSTPNTLDKSTEEINVSDKSTSNTSDISTEEINVSDNENHTQMAPPPETENNTYQEGMELPPEPEVPTLVKTEQPPSFFPEENLLSLILDLNEQMKNRCKMIEQGSKDSEDKLLDRINELEKNLTDIKKICQSQEDKIKKLKDENKMLKKDILEISSLKPQPTPNSPPLPTQTRFLLPNSPPSPSPLHPSTTPLTQTESPSHTGSSNSYSKISQPTPPMQQDPSESYNEPSYQPSPYERLCQRDIEANTKCLIIGDSVIRRLKPDMTFPEGPSVNLSVSGLTLEDLQEWLSNARKIPHIQTVVFHIGVNTCKTKPITEEMWRLCINKVKHVFHNATVFASSMICPRGSHPMKQCVIDSNLALKRVCQNTNLTYINNDHVFLTERGAPRLKLYSDGLHPSPSGTAKMGTLIRDKIMQRNSPGNMQLYDQRANLPSDGPVSTGTRNNQLPGPSNLRQEQRSGRRTLLPTPKLYQHPFNSYSNNAPIPKVNPTPNPPLGQGNYFPSFPEGGNSNTNSNYPLSLPLSLSLLVYYAIE